MKTINYLFFISLTLFSLPIFSQRLFTPNGDLGLSSNTVNIGIGTSSPLSDLHLLDSTGISHIVLEGKPKLPNGPTDVLDGFSSAISFGGGHIGHHSDRGLSIDNYKSRVSIGSISSSINIGVELPASPAFLKGRVNMGYGVYVYSLAVADPSNATDTYTLPDVFKFGVNGNSNLNGRVAIGTTCFPTDTAYKVAIRGKIMTEGMKMKLIGKCWADYVFHKNYQLPSLYEVEKYINENKHLPEIPSEKEVVENGLEVAEMMKLQMQKIEELTLYMIEMKKENDAMKKENEIMKKENKIIKKEIAELKAK